MCGKRFFFCAYDEHAHLGAGAERVVELRASRVRCRIDRGEVIAQHLLAQDEPGHAPGRACRRAPLKTASIRFETGARTTLERLVRFDRCLNGRTHTMRVCAAVKTAVEKEQRRERGASTR